MGIGMKYEVFCFDYLSMLIVNFKFVGLMLANFKFVGRILIVNFKFDCLRIVN